VTIIKEEKENSAPSVEIVMPRGPTNGPGDAKSRTSYRVFSALRHQPQQLHYLSDQCDAVSSTNTPLLQILFITNFDRSSYSKQNL
jgi:hypothetical protein